MAIKIVILSTILFLNSLKLFSQNEFLSEDSLFSFIKIKTDSIISAKYPNLNLGIIK